MQFLCTDITVPLKWRDVVNHANAWYIFGPPRNGARNYESLFKDRTDSTWLKKIYQIMGTETWGDV